MYKDGQKQFLRKSTFMLNVWFSAHSIYALNLYYKRYLVLSF